MNTLEGQTVDSNSSLAEHPITVLLIDDQPMVGEVIRRMLATEADIIFHTCHEPTQAIQRAVEIAPTVILQDLVMPEIDGLLLLRFFRANANTRHIPIIVLSAKEEPQLKAEAFACDANDYLVKLPDKIELIARIRYHSKAYIHYIKQSQLQAQVETQVQILDQQSQQLKAALLELQRTQSQLIQAEKMASLGQLVAGVVHAINNPINFIYGNLPHVDEYTQDLMKLVQLYQQEYPHVSPHLQAQAEDIDLNFLINDLPKLMSSMKFGSERICQIISSLKNFSRLDESAMKAVNIHEGIDSTLLILQHRLKAKPEHLGIQVVKEYSKLPLVECYAGQLNQVYMNILSYVIDVLNDSEKDSSAEEIQKRPSVITISTEIKSEVEELKLDSDFLLSHQSAVIRIKDNSPGMDLKTTQQIFRPFLTPESTERGTGLGLALSYQIIVDKHGGMLKCFSELGQGTEFVIEIPIQQSQR